MAYERTHWEKKIAGRSDLSTHLVHLTRSADRDGKLLSPVGILIEILLERRISGSTTASGFVVGEIPATCFQDAPLYSIAQNVYAEEQYRQAVSNAKVRYVGVGLMFSKLYVYQRGGRPVVYEDTERAKEILPDDEWWRIVRLDMADESNIVDWTHEREWRVPGGFEFDLDKVTVVVPNKRGFHEFVSGCDARKKDTDILNEIRGVVSLGSVFY